MPIFLFYRSLKIILIILTLLLLLPHYSWVVRSLSLIKYILGPLGAVTNINSNVYSLMCKYNKIFYMCNFIWLLIICSSWPVICFVSQAYLKKWNLSKISNISKAPVQKVNFFRQDIEFLLQEKNTLTSFFFFFYYFTSGCGWS